MHLLSLLLPLLSLASALPEALAPAAAPSCDAISKSRLAIAFTNFQYGASWVFSTPAHLATAQAAVSFTVRNNLIPVPIACSARSSQVYAFFTGAPSYACDVSQVPAAVGAKVGFTFDTAGNGTVGLTASWNCVNSQSKRT
jgi:hypothetical protein